MVTYKLLIKKERRKRPGKNPNSKVLQKLISFSVVDLGKGSYPLNWVCNLPQDITKSTFAETVKQKEPAKFAIQLLNQARRNYQEGTIKQEIDKRLHNIQAQINQEATLKETLRKKREARNPPLQ